MQHTLMVKSAIRVHKKWVVCGPWFLRYVYHGFGEVCHGQNASYQTSYSVKSLLIWWDVVGGCIVPWVQRKKREKIGLWDIFCTLWMKHITKPGIWRNFFSGDTQQTSTGEIEIYDPCFIFVCHADVSWQVFGFWYMTYVKSVVRRMEFICGYVAHICDKVVKIGLLRYMLFLDCIVKGTSQNPGYVHVHSLPAWGWMSHGSVFTVNT